MIRSKLVRNKLVINLLTRNRLVSNTPSNIGGRDSSGPDTTEKNANSPYTIYFLVDISARALELYMTRLYYSRRFFDFLVGWDERLLGPWLSGECFV